jgi:hypothetical protein
VLQANLQRILSQRACLSFMCEMNPVCLSDLVQTSITIELLVTLETDLFESLKTGWKNGPWTGRILKQYDPIS